MATKTALATALPHLSPDLTRISTTKNGKYRAVASSSSPSHTQIDGQKRNNSFSVHNLSLSSDPFDDGALPKLMTSVITSAPVTNSNGASGFRVSRPLALKEFYSEQSLTLAFAARKCSLAEEQVAIKRLEELEILRHALHSEAEESRSLSYKSQQAVAIARAVQATLVAEQKLATEHIQAAKVYLQVSRDAAEAVETRLESAQAQLGAILKSTKVLGLTIRHPTDVYNFKPRQYRPQDYLPPPDSDHGDSDFESFYEDEARSENADEQPDASSDCVGEAAITA